MKQKHFDALMCLQAKQLLAVQESWKGRAFKEYEFKVFSQWGEDGLLQHLIRSIPIAHKTFIEFGVEDFSESNGRFLLMNNQWQGYVMDSSRCNIARLKNAYYYWRYDLVARAATINCDNVNALLAESGFDKDLGILSIDIDGMDYWVWKAITRYKPRIVVVEYNAVFGAKRKISVPYDANFCRRKAHYSGQYYGASLAALEGLAHKKGYALVGTNSAGNNAFFVRRDLLGRALKEVSAKQAFTDSHFSDTRGANGKLTHLRGEARQQLIQGLPAMNTETGLLESI